MNFGSFFFGGLLFIAFAPTIIFLVCVFNEIFSYIFNNVIRKGKADTPAIKKMKMCKNVAGKILWGATILFVPFWFIIVFIMV